MALIPENEAHKLQIVAGTLGRNRGHQFEKDLASAISSTVWEENDFNRFTKSHRVIGNPAVETIKYIANDLGITEVKELRAWWLGGLATSGLGDALNMTNSERIKRSKTDVLININNQFVKGISVKTCSKKTPTNDQLYFTTASAFSRLLRSNNIPFSNDAENAMKMFCGDNGYRPIDMIDISKRLSDPERWFFEELPQKGRSDIIGTLKNYQKQVSRVLLQLAYPEDPHPPDYILHLTVKPNHVDLSDLALFTVDELIEFSCRYAGFLTKKYKIHKGRFKHDTLPHYAPRFGFIQFQRGGQKQHPTQLQFNLQAGYFNKLVYPEDVLL